MQQCPSLESGQAGKSESCKGCPNASKCSSAKPDPDVGIIRKNLGEIKVVVAVLSGKGGVGKSTIACNIAKSMAQRGICTLLLDFDLSGPSAPRLTKTFDRHIFESDGKYIPLKVEENFSVISVGHLEYMDEEGRVYDSSSKNFIIKRIFKKFTFSGVEVMIIDTPPNITEEHLALYNYFQHLFGIVVTTPQKFSTNDVQRQLMFCRKANIEIIGLVENMKGFRCTECNYMNKIFEEGSVKKLCEKSGISYLGSFELKKSIAKASDFGEQIVDKVYENISDKIMDLLCK